MARVVVTYLVTACFAVILAGGCQNSTTKAEYSARLVQSIGESMFQDVKVAAISFRPEKFGVEANVKRLEKAFRTAASQGAQLAVGSEGVIEGYVVNQIVGGEIPPERMLEVAIPIDHPIIKRFQALARELDMCLAFSFAELVGEEVYNCAVFIDNNGRICGKYHKMQFAEGYHPSWWYNRLGKKSRAFDTPFGRCGFMICNDRWNPVLARIAVLDGAQYLLIPSFGGTSEAQDRAVLARARENGVPIVEANVGVTLIISKGEIKKVCRDEEAVTIGTISIPAAPSPQNRDKQEAAFLKWREKEMRRLYEALKDKRKRFLQSG